MLNILTPVFKTHFRDFTVTNTNALNPNNAATFEQGQWWQLDANNVNQITVVGANDDPALAFPVWSKRGEGSTQALSKLTVILIGQFMADTDQYNANGAYNVGTRLTVRNGVLTPITLQVTGFCHGVVVLPPASNNNNLRFVRMVGACAS